MHPNSWAILQAFRIICKIFGLTSTPESFLYYYNTYPNTPVGWLSLSSRPGNVRFAAFTTSYKNFKDYFFKVFVEPDGRDLFYNTDGSTKFPFHWIEKPTSLDHRFWESLSPFDKEILMVGNQLPCRLPTRELIALYGSSKQWADLNGEHLLLSVAQLIAQCFLPSCLFCRYCCDHGSKFEKIHEYFEKAGEQE